MSVYKKHCDHCGREVMTTVDGFPNLGTYRCWCEKCFALCLESLGLDVMSMETYLKRDGALFICDLYADAVPKKDEIDRLRPHLLNVWFGMAWKVSYARLERMIELGMVNALGNKLTIRGQRWM